MATRPRFEALFRWLGLVGMLLCGAGAAVGIAVVLIRVPMLAATRLEIIFGTLQGVAVSLLFAIAALLINLTLMIRRASHPLGFAPRTERIPG
jgi:hypothetical protein